MFYLLYTTQLKWKYRFHTCNCSNIIGLEYDKNNSFYNNNWENIGLAIQQVKKRAIWPFESILVLLQSQLFYYLNISIVSLDFMCYTFHF